MDYSLNLAYQCPPSMRNHSDKSIIAKTIVYYVMLETLYWKVSIPYLALITADSLRLIHLTKQLKNGCGMLFHCSGKTMITYGGCGNL